MPATIHGDTTLEFGCPEVESCYMQSTSAQREGKYSEAANHEDDVVGIATHHTNMGSIEGEYLYRGQDIVNAIGDTIDAALNSLGFATVIVYQFGRKKVKDAFTMGDFKAVGVDFPDAGSGSGSE